MTAKEYEAIRRIVVGIWRKANVHDLPPEDLEDCVSIVLLRLCRLASEGPIENRNALVRKIAHGTIVDMKRRISRENQVFTEIYSEIDDSIG